MNNREWLYSLDVADLADWFDSEHESTLDGDTAALNAKIAELTAERDKLQEQLLIGWECECRLQAERELYRSKFGKCLDYADAIHALMDDEGMA